MFTQCHSHINESPTNILSTPAETLSPHHSCKGLHSSLYQSLVFTPWVAKLWPWQWQVKNCQTLVDVGDLHISTLCNLSCLLPFPFIGHQGRLSYIFQDTEFTE